MKRTYSHIDMDERRKIARWRMAGLTVGIIAEKLGRHMFIDEVIPDLNGYYCVTAHDMACERRAKLRKLVRFSHVRQSVIERIVRGWSPQQIAGRMRLERHPISVNHKRLRTTRTRRSPASSTPIMPRRSGLPSGTASGRSRARAYQESEVIILRRM